MLGVPIRLFGACTTPSELSLGLRVVRVDLHHSRLEGLVAELVFRTHMKLCWEMGMVLFLDAGNI